MGRKWVPSRSPCAGSCEIGRGPRQRPNAAVELRPRQYCPRPAPRWLRLAAAPTASAAAPAPERLSAPRRRKGWRRPAPETPGRDLRFLAEPPPRPPNTHGPHAPAGGRAGTGLLQLSRPPAPPAAANTSRRRGTSAWHRPAAVSRGKGLLRLRAAPDPPACAAVHFFPCRTAPARPGAALAAGQRSAPATAAAHRYGAEGSGREIAPSHHTLRRPPR